MATLACPAATISDRIAVGLFPSLNTVCNRIFGVFARPGFANRAGAFVRAREAGLGRDRS